MSTLVVAIASGCVSNPTPAPVFDLNHESVTAPEHIHVVNEGESLYLVAWIYGRDFQELADINDITKPYKIYPNQKILLYRLEEPKKRVAPKTRLASIRPSNKPEKTSKNSRVASKTRVKTTTKANKVAEKPQRMAAVKHWGWPTKGKIIAQFGGSKSNKGIDIGGKIGQPVNSVANGRVVYSGSGLKNYGKLVIVKHNDTYLSAYAHNQALMVKEGETVKLGQTIARMGRSAAGTPVLHFELRKKGKPVNPMNYLSQPG